MKNVICPKCNSNEIYVVSEDYFMCENCHHKDIKSEFIRKPYAISLSDGHSEDWFYYEDKETCYKAFEDMKQYEDDIHVYKYNEQFGYEVIDSYWIGDE